MLNKETIMLVIDQLEDISQKMYKYGMERKALSVASQADSLAQILLYLPRPRTKFMSEKESYVKVTPYDPTVQKVVQKMGPGRLKGVEEVRIEPSSAKVPGSAAYVTNKDLVEEGKPGVIHLNLKDIERNLKGAPEVLSPGGKPLNVVEKYLEDVVLPHEHVHVEQLEDPRYPGEFGPSPESKAERAENWKPLEEQFGLIPKMASELDKIANQLEKIGMVKESEILDSITNSMEKTAAAPATTAPTSVGGMSQVMVQIIKSLRDSHIGSDLEDILKNNRNNPDKAAHTILKNYLMFMVDAQNFSTAQKIAVKMLNGQTLQGIAPSQQTQTNKSAGSTGADIKMAAVAPLAPTVLPMAIIITMFSAKTGVPILQMSTQLLTKMIHEYETRPKVQQVTQRGTPTAPTAPQ
jgi:hypothetical protein